MRRTEFLCNLVPGKITALISPPKTGKTTLRSHLLARFARGGRLADRAVVPARALVVSEESASDWDARCRRLGPGANVQFLCRPFQADYLVRTDAAGAPLAPPCPEMNHILTQATDKLTQQEILERWPAEGDPPDRSTLSRWLKRAARQGVICCSGIGYRSDPFRYWLPGREGLLWPGDRASEEEKQAWRDRCAEHYRRLREQTPSV